MKNNVISRHDGHCAFCSNTYPDWKVVDADQQLVARDENAVSGRCLATPAALGRCVIATCFVHIIKRFLGMAGCAVHKAMLCYTKQNLQTPDTWEFSAWWTKMWPRLLCLRLYGSTTHYSSVILLRLLYFYCTTTKWYILLSYFHYTTAESWWFTLHMCS